MQCRRSATECVIKLDDERRRPISRAYMAALAERVTMLESMLEEKGAEVPPVQYPAQTTRGRPAMSASYGHLPSKGEQPSPPSGQDVHHVSSSYASSTSNATGVHDERSSPIGILADDKKEGLVSKLLSTRGHLSLDQLSGRHRFYGGTANFHIHSQLGDGDDANSHEATLQARRAEDCIRSLAAETHDYLMDLFWQHYNSVLHVVHQEAFDEDRRDQRTRYYSGFLHVCILAMGFRFSDKSRADMQHIALPNRENLLHREAKLMLDLELQRPGGLPSIAALLILADYEAGVGRDNVGWMYAGMAMRLCYDLGLHLDGRNAGLSQREMDVRRVALLACVIYDRYWSLFLGRPLTMKSRDLEVYSLTNQFERLGSCMPAGNAQSLDGRIYEALFALMEIAGNIVEQAEYWQHNNQAHIPEQSAYFKMAALDSELHNWVSRLSPDLRYTEENKQNAPLSFYMLHQQYHATLILLHRPFARYDDATNPDQVEEEEEEDSNALDRQLSQASRSICTKSAVAMARIFWYHRQRFDGKLMSCAAMQHAGSAATALVAALAYMPDAAERKNYCQYLEILHAALQDMAHAYQPAERMAALVKAVMLEIKGVSTSPASTPTAARRGSIDIEADRGTAKRQQTSRGKNCNSMAPPSIAHTSSRKCSPASSVNSFQSVPGQAQASDFAIVLQQTHAWSGHMMPQAPVQPAPMMAPPPAGPLPPYSHPTPMWTHEVFHPQAVSQSPTMAGMPELLTEDMAHLEFLNGMPLTSKVDWSKWEFPSGMPDAMSNLNGSHSRDRYDCNYPNMPAKECG